MWTKSWLIIFILAVSLSSFAQHKHFIPLPAARFNTGDSAAWSTLTYNDSQWKSLHTGQVWQEQGFDEYHGYAWYRIHVVIPSSLRNSGYWKDSLRIFLAHVNDVDATYLNGVKIGKTGAFPEDEGGYVSKWPAVREYHVAVNNPAIHWDGDNVIAVRDYDGGGSGGIFMGTPYIDMLERTDGLDITMPVSEIQYLPDGLAIQPIHVFNKFNTAVSGVLDYNGTKVNLQLPAFGHDSFVFNVANNEGVAYYYRFTEKNSGIEIYHQQTFPYILKYG
jgi:alpha-galactosidase